VTDRKDLILGVSVGYKMDVLRPFVLSLKDSGFRGETVFFVSDTDSETVDFLLNNGIVVEQYETYRFMMVAPHLIRWIRFHEHLAHIRNISRTSDQYGRILMVDTRDVYFQGNPFPSDSGKDISYYLEDSRWTLGSQRENVDWFMQSFGHETLTELADKPISCGGTTIGTFDGVSEYLAQMCALILKLPAETRCIPGIDQPLHNFIVHKNLVPGAEIVENQKHIATLGLLSEDELTLDESGTLVNADGSVSSIVHQYDRCERLSEFIINKYAL
jgi:hypothetical protein